MAEGDVGKVIHAAAAAELAEFMRGFVRSGKMRQDDAVEALKEVLIRELEANGVKVKRRAKKDQGA